MLGEGGRDATEAFEDVGHSDEARSILEKYYVGLGPEVCLRLSLLSRARVLSRLRLNSYCTMIGNARSGREESQGSRSREARVRFLLSLELARPTDSGCLPRLVAVSHTCYHSLGWSRSSVTSVYPLPSFTNRMSTDLHSLLQQVLCCSDVGLAIELIDQGIDARAGFV